MLTHKINLKTDTPIYSPNYRYPHNFRTDIENEDQKLLKQNIIRPSNSPYNSPVWVVPKKPDASGKRKVRMVIDSRKVNANTIPDKYPLPNIDDLFAKVGKTKVLSSIDLASGFHQIEIHNESIPKTAFSTDSGHYEFLRMPFGLCNAPPTFQRAMNTIFNNIPNVLVCRDDIIIYSNTIEEHFVHLKTVFNLLSPHNLKIQLDKTEFIKSELLLLGHIISKEGIKPNPRKLEAIDKFPLPKTKQKSRQFLGLTGYYRKFIKNYAQIAKPLTSALHNDAEPIPSLYEDSFQTLKQLLINAPIIQLPDFSQNFTLTTDASNVALGAVLSQNSGGKEHPIAFASRTLNKSELNYSPIEKECLALV